MLAVLLISKLFHKSSATQTNTKNGIFKQMTWPLGNVLCMSQLT